MRNLSYANAFLQIFSISGIIAASWLAIVGVNLINLDQLVSYEAVRRITSKSVVIPWILTAVSVLGTVANFMIPRVKFEDLNVSIDKVKRHLSLGFRVPTLRASIIALSMFWALAQVFVLTYQDVSGSSTVNMMQDYMSFAIVGLMVGTIVAAHFSKDFIESGFVPLGMFGASICMFLVPFLVHPVALVLLYSLTGFFGGLILVPVNALLQYNTRPNNSGSVIALANLIQAVVLVAFLFVFTMMVRNTDVRPQNYFIGLAVISVGDYRVICRLIEGKYPNYASVIPQNNPFVLTLDRQSALSAVRRVSIFSSQASSLVKLSLSENKLTLSAQDIDFSTSAQEVVDCQYVGANMNIGFKATFLLDIFNNISSNEVTFALADPSRAGVVEPAEQEEGESLLMLLMPMMLND